LTSIKLAKIISHVLSAPFFALYSLVIIYIANNDAYNPLPAYLAILIGCIFLTILPIAPIALNVIKGDIDVFVSDRKRRPKFYLYALLSHLAGASVSYILRVEILTIILLVFFFVTLSVAIINFKTKISAHTSGIAGPATYMTYFLGSTYIFLYLIIIPVAWARIKLKAHTLQQTILGTIVAIIITFLTCYIAHNILF